MRVPLTALFVLLAGVGMIIAVPSLWATATVVSPDGFAEAASQAAAQPEVRAYFADQIADEVAQTTTVPLAGSAVKPLATSYTQSPKFVTDFTEIARQQHAWLFTAPSPDTSIHQMELNITPMVNSTLADAPIPVTIDQPITVPIDQNRLTAGSLEQSGTQLTLIGWISAVVAAVAGLAALVISRNRAAVVGWLGLAALAAGVTGVLIATYLERMASDNVTASDLGTQQVVDVVAGDVLHGLTVTSLIVGGLGLLVALVGVIASVAIRRR